MKLDHPIILTLLALAAILLLYRLLSKRRRYPQGPGYGRSSRLLNRFDGDIPDMDDYGQFSRREAPSRRDSDSSGWFEFFGGDSDSGSGGSSD